MTNERVTEDWTIYNHAYRIAAVFVCEATNTEKYIRSFQIVSAQQSKYNK